MALPHQSAQRIPSGTSDSPTRSLSNPAASVSPTTSHGSSERLPTTVAGLLGRLQAEVTCAICSKNTTCPLCKTPITKRSLAQQGAFGDVAAAVHRVIEAFEQMVGSSLEALLDSPCIDDQFVAEPQPNLSQAYPYPAKEAASQGETEPTSQLTLPAMASNAPTQNDILIASSNLLPEHLTCLQKLSKRLNISLTSELTNQTTHLVVETNEERMATKRTKKYLVAVLRGCWVVSTDWVAACLRQSNHVSEDAFEVLGDSKTTIPGGPRRARIALRSMESVNRDSNCASVPHSLALEGTPLFSHMHFVYDSPSTWSGSSLVDLKECITFAGGQEYTRSETYHGLDLDNLGIVSEPSDISKYLAKQPLGVRLTPAVVLVYNDNNGTRTPYSARRKHWEKRLGLASRGRHSSSRTSNVFQEAWQAHFTPTSSSPSATKPCRSTTAVPMSTAPALPLWSRSAAMAAYQTDQGQTAMDYHSAGYAT